MDRIEKLGKAESPSAKTVTGVHARMKRANSLLFIGFSTLLLYLKRRRKCLAIPFVPLGAVARFGQFDVDRVGAGLQNEVLSNA